MKKQFQSLMFAIILITGSMTMHAQAPNWLTAGNTGANNFKLGTTNGFDLNVIANNKTRITFKKATTNSSIEIGAGTPISGYGVHLLGGSGDVLSQGLYIQRADAIPSNQDGALAISFSTSSWGSATSLTGGTCNFILFPTVNSLIPDLAFSTNNVAPQLVIKNNGNVGIGTSLPTQALHVNNGAIFITGNNPSGGPMLLLGGGGVSDPNGEWGIEYSSAGGLNFWKPWPAVNNGNYYLFLKDNGNVGIGTNNPTAQLTVTGKTLMGDPAVVNINTIGNYNLYVQNGILTEKLRVSVVNSATWADYVFGADYKLKNLDEVDSYIKENKHLPGIPSSEEVQKDGVDMVDMDAKLLSKIEELTLYVIDQDKRIDQLEKELSSK